MNEYLANIRFIKMYSWEKPLSKFLAGKQASLPITLRGTVTGQLGLYCSICQNMRSLNPLEVISHRVLQFAMRR
jgi:hypothetical protein